MCPGRQRGTMAIQFLVILVPVLLVMMGFAVDLGRIYLIRGELNQAASAMALAAASQLNGTQLATQSADTAAQVTANKYNFGSIVVGDQGTALTSNVSAPAYFATALDALNAYGSTSATSLADGTTARHATVNLSADAPLLFWSLLSLGQSRKTSIAASASAGVSPPLCTACGIEPFAIAALDQNELDNFGFAVNGLYTLGAQCAPGNAAAIPGTLSRIQYGVINRLDVNSAYTEPQQLFRDGAQGLTPSTSSVQSCAVAGTTESLWAAVTGQACAAANPAASLEYAMCGVSTRLSDTAPAVCAGNTDLAQVATGYAQDTDVTYVTDYSAYAGNNRRLMTLPVVDSLATLTILGFRQFLLEPNDAGGTINNPADGDGRIVAMYVGVKAPVKQGRFDGSCAATAGPGKVVLLQ